MTGSGRLRHRPGLPGAQKIAPAPLPSQMGLPHLWGAAQVFLLTWPAAFCRPILAGPQPASPTQELPICSPLNSPSLLCKAHPLDNGTPPNLPWAAPWKLLLHYPPNWVSYLIPYLLSPKLADSVAPI